MSLELLPNEILLDLFEYFDGIKLLHIFYGLNSRFNYLLCKQYALHWFNFSYIRKSQFDEICQRYFPYLINRICALRFYEHSAPGQLDLFFTYISSLQQLIGLRSLSLSYIASSEIISKFFQELLYLQNLTHLKINCSYQRHYTMNFQWVVDTIWNLPKLRYCSLNRPVTQSRKFCIPNEISSTLRSVDLSSYQLHINQINQFIKHTPYLKHLSICIDTSSTVADNYILPSLSTLISFNTICHTFETSYMTLFLKNLSNLRHLNISLIDDMINGYQWEQILRHYLRKLKTFKLDMTNTISMNQNIEEYINELINSFQNSFWIDERQWFVHCYVCDTIIRLFTSNTFSSYYRDQKLPSIWKSTNPNDNQQTFYHSITTINETFFDQPMPSDICLSNLGSINIRFPLHQQFRSIIPNLSRLFSLHVILFSDIYQSELQNLLDQTPHLHILHIKQDPSLSEQLSFFKCRSSSVNNIDLLELNYSLDEVQCLLFCRSPIASQCQTCSINVKTRYCIVILVKEIINLQVLRVDCQEIIEENKVEVIQWLKDNLPSTCFVSKDSRAINSVQIWIQKT